MLSNAAIRARDEVFRDEVLAAVCFHARGVIAEPAGTENHLFRVNFARGILNSPENYSQSLAWTMAADLQIAAVPPEEKIPEDLLLARVELAWNALITPLA